MAIDLDAIREKFNKMNAGGSGGNSDFLAKFLSLPKEGNTRIRILPPEEDSDKQFFAETSIHRIKQADGTTKNVHCRKIHGEACPLCDAYYKIWDTINLINDSEDEKSKELRAVAGQIKARPRYYMNVLDRESGEVKIFSTGQIVFKKIISTIMDEDFGDITDVNDGHDFKIVKEMEGGWPKYDQSAPRPKSEPLADSAKGIAEIMDQLHDIHGLVKLEDYDTVREVAQTILSSGESESSSELAEPEEVTDKDYLEKLSS